MVAWAYLGKFWWGRDMPNSVLVTQEQALNRATVIQAKLAGTVLRLVQNFTPAYLTNRTQLLASEANFAGYPTGGYNLANWTGPGLSPSTGAILTSPQVIVAPNVSNNVTNNLTALWIETTGNSPVTLLTGIINPTITVLAPTDQFPLIVQDVEGLTG